MQLKEIPVLPIPRLVFYPNTSIPLLIVEPHYRDMVKEVLDHGLPLVITLAEPRYFEGRIRYLPRLVATMGRPVLIEELADGSMKIVLHGMMRVKLTHIVQNLPYLIFNVVPIEDDFEKTKIDTQTSIKLREMLDHWLNVNIENSLERENFSKTIQDVPSLVDHLCFFMIKDVETRQLLLETTSLFERITLLSSLFPFGHQETEDFSTRDALKSFEHLEEKILINH